jgi:hypothetical protein
MLFYVEREQVEIVDFFSTGNKDILVFVQHFFLLMIIYFI